MSQQRSPLPVKAGDTNALVAWVQDVARQARLAWRLFRDERVSFWLKLIPPLALGYVLFPIDILPDVVPLVGQLDDIAVILLGLKLFIELAPPDVRLEHLRALGARIREWRVVDGEEQAPTVVDGQFQISGSAEPVQPDEETKETAQPSLPQ